MVFLIVGFFLDPSSWVVSQDPLAHLIKDKDENGERNAWEPPVDLQRVHLQTLVHAWSVGEESSKAGLENETEVEDPVGHSLSEDRILSGLADDQVSPLHNNNRDKE